MATCNTDTPGLILVNADPIYADPVYNAVENNRSYLRKWLPWVDQSTCVEDTRLFLTTCKQQYAMQKQFNALMFFNDEFIGITGYNSLDHGNHRGEIGYWMIENAQGKGLMTSAVQKIIQLGFESFDLNRQVIRAAEQNNPSRSLAERLGFQFESIERQSTKLRDTYYNTAVYSLLKQDWQND